MLLLPSIVVTCLLTKITFAGFTEKSDSGWHGVSNYGVTSYGSGNDINAHQGLSYGSFPSYGSDGEFYVGHGIHAGNVQQTFAQSVPISQHVEVTKPLVVPVVKNIGNTMKEGGRTRWRRDAVRSGPASHFSFRGEKNIESAVVARPGIGTRVFRLPGDCSKPLSYLVK
ncbi:uncharacterized protein LOC105189367 isoform X2 [Harpegnathos saltator]|uniref:uncharacterized protein LOC105189367 isoform X2 n=1 Tax=Harpegnathos saltator TaxID=610380 RepID=UPI000DBEE8F3|nr:uncharacterized protein LOC105189367 isoform X2 [Harpegnathos saltator]